MSKSIKVVCWNIGKGTEPWRELAEMARREEADVALLQEAGSPPDELGHSFHYENDIVWDRCSFRYENDVVWDPPFFDRWPLVVRLSDRVEVEWFRQIPPISELGERDIGASGIGTMAAARVTPRARPEEAFVAASMYARWMRAHPTAGKRPGRHVDGSAHRILSDLQTFIDYADPSMHRILAAGDLNMCYNVTGRSSPWLRLERMVWDRFDALGLAFLGPQAPNGRPSATPQPGVPADTKNVPTYYTVQQKCAANANRQLDYAFASRGFHERVTVRALNGIDEWGSSDHCRLLIEIATD